MNAVPLRSAGLRFGRRKRSRAQETFSLRPAGADRIEALLFTPNPNPERAIGYDRIGPDLFDRLGGGDRKRGAGDELTVVLQEVGSAVGALITPGKRRLSRGEA